MIWLSEWNPVMSQGRYLYEKRERNWCC